MAAKEGRSWPSVQASASGKQEQCWVTAFQEATAEPTRNPTSTTINYCTVGCQINYLSGGSEALRLWSKQMMYYSPDIFISRR